MPETTLTAVADHATVAGDSVRAHYTNARRILADLAALGVDYDDVVDLLERQGVATFVTAWNDLLASVGSELQRRGAES
jgi:transaldolase